MIQGLAGSKPFLSSDSSAYSVTAEGKMARIRRMKNPSPAQLRPILSDEETYVVPTYAGLFHPSPASRLRCSSEGGQPAIFQVL